MHNARPRRSAESACLLNNFYGRSKAENGRTKLIVLGQIVHTVFKCNFIHCREISKSLCYECRVRGSFCERSEEYDVKTIML